ncbi:MAG: hypothetical protein DWH91_14375 [Planctomycetota bacterium]|nr:MAG: hypothetical protein DWH91_14375 [Planctomycetota bacterium]
MFARVGHKVMKLQRVAFGPIFLGRMGRGEIRELRKDEMERLVAMIERNEGPGDDRRSSQRPARPKRTMDASAAPPARGEMTRSPMDTPKPSRPELRGLGLGDVSDEEMMGLVERPTRSTAPRGRRPFSSSARRPPGEAPRTNFGGDRPRREPSRERGPAHADDRRSSERGSAPVRGIGPQAGAPRGAADRGGPGRNPNPRGENAGPGGAAKPRGLVRKPFDRPPLDRPIKAGTRFKAERPDADRPSETKGLGRRSPGQPFSHKKPKGAKGPPRGR